jgi:hypothetical protein
MAMIGLILNLAGFAVLLFGWWGAIREIFAESRGIGYLSFMVPIIPLIWTVIHWDDLKRECILMLVGSCMVAAGILFFPLPGAA